MQRDEHQQVIGYTPETEWDATERAWMLALDDYESTLCPSCGMPMDECHDPLMPTRWIADVQTCQTTLMRNIALQEYRTTHNDKPERYDALTTRIHPRQ